MRTDGPPFAMEPTEAKEIARQIGFKNFLDLSSGVSLTAVFREAGLADTPAVYLLFDSETKRLYIGQTKRLLNRYAQHVYDGRTIDYIAWIVCPVKQLDEKETSYIERALALGYDLVNKMKMPAFRTETAPYDEIVLPVRQDEHLKNVGLGLFSDIHRVQRVFEGADAQQQERWERLREHPRHKEMLEAARRYIEVSIPDYRETVGNFWTLFVAPASKRNAVLPCISIVTGPVQTFEIYCYSRSKEACFVSMELSAYTLFQAPSMLADFLRVFPWADLVWGETPLRSGMPLPEWQEPAAEELQQFLPLRRPYPSYEDRTEDIVRPVSLARLRPPVTLTCTLEHFPMIFERSLLIETAASSYAVASMRYSRIVHPENHNPIAMAAVLGEANTSE